MFNEGDIDGGSREQAADEAPALSANVVLA